MNPFISESPSTKDGFKIDQVLLSKIWLFAKIPKTFILSVQTPALDEIRSFTEKVRLSVVGQGYKIGRRGIQPIAAFPTGNNLDDGIDRTGFIAGGCDFKGVPQKACSPGNLIILRSCK